MAGVPNVTDQPLFMPTGEGDYRMRCGKKVHITGFAWRRWCGKTDSCEIDEFEMWRRDGRYDIAGGNPEFDIIGKWIEP